MITPSETLRAAMLETGAVLALGVWDGLSARLARRAGARALHASGGAISRAAGHPDLGLLGLAEMQNRIAEIVQAADGLPVIADADTGYGGLLNVAHTVRLYARLGVAALHIEDQPFPKRCGLMDDIEVVPVSEMLGRVRAALAARPQGGPLIIARTDAVKPEGLGAAVERMRAYMDAGADVAFIEGLESEQALEEVARSLPNVQFLFNASMSAKGLPLTPDRLAELGYRIVIYPGDAQRAAISAMDAAYTGLLQDGDSRGMAERLASGTFRDEIVGTAELIEAEREWAR